MSETPKRVSDIARTGCPISPKYATRGLIQIGYPRTDNYIELRKRRWKTRPDVVRFRYRNSDFTRKYFNNVRSVFDAQSISYELTLTKKTRKPRAMEITFDPYDPFTPRNALNLALKAFGAPPDVTHHFDLNALGTIRTDVVAAPTDVVLPPSDKPPPVTYWIGYGIGRALRWLEGR